MNPFDRADFYLTAIVTLMVVLLMFATAAIVGVARKRHGIAAPAVSGHPVFERAYRVQMNSLEWAVMMLPCLWLSALYVGDAAAASVGGVWWLARAVYVVRYLSDPARRGPAFLVAGLAFGALGLMAAGGVVSSYLG